MKEPLDNARVEKIRDLIRIGLTDIQIGARVLVAAQTVNRIRNAKGRYAPMEATEADTVCHAAWQALNACVRKRQMPRNRQRFFV